MANAALNIDLAEISGDESVKSVLGSGSTKKAKRTPRASQADLDSLKQDVKSIEQNFTQLGSKFDIFLSTWMDTAGSARQRPNTTSTSTSVSNTEPGTSRAETVVRIPRGCLPEGLIDNSTNRDMDTLSLTPGQRERRELLGEDRESHSSGVDSDIESESGERFRKYYGARNTFLRDSFGKDAMTKPERCNAGIALDLSQNDVLKDTWRCENPTKLTTYKESYRTSFPVSEEAEEILKVPSVDTLVTSILTKKYEEKSGLVKQNSLVSQPMKDLEKLAYSGQQAARMGIVINLYMQQALGNLLQTLSDKDANIDSAIQCVRDIFAINTKSLDQLGRTGAYHHLVRRKSAMADSGLNESKDCRYQIWGLPLSHEGLFGSGLEQKLKERAEINKQLAELLPEMDKKGKRKNIPQSELVLMYPG